MDRRFSLRRALVRKTLRFLPWLTLLAIQLAGAATDAALHALPKDSALAGRLGAIGMVLVGDDDERLRAMATGFLVSTCHVLTAAHALARQGEHVRLGLPVRFVPATGDRAFAVTQRAVSGQVVAASADFVMQGKSSRFSPDAFAQDWALIELDRPLPNIEPFKLLYPGSTPAAETEFSVAGYADFGNMRFLYAQEHCLGRAGGHGAANLPGVVVADCAVRPGMSGGPLLIDSGRQLIVAGIVTERFETGPKVMALAVSTQAFADKVASAMRASQVCAVGQPFALAPGLTH